MCTSLSTACWATSSGVENSGAHVDVEAQVGEGRDDDLLAPVVAVLAHLGDEDARAASLLRLELLGGREHLRDRPSSPASERYTPLIVRISARCRPQTFSRASEISPTVALARAASTPSASRLPAPDSADAVSASRERRTASSSRSARRRSSLAICER